MNRGIIAAMIAGAAVVAWSQTAIQDGGQTSPLQPSDVPTYETDPTYTASAAASISLFRVFSPAGQGKPTRVDVAGGQSNRNVFALSTSADWLGNQQPTLAGWPVRTDSIMASTTAIFPSFSAFVIG